MSRIGRKYAAAQYATRNRLFNVVNVTDFDFGTVAIGTNDYLVPVPGALPSDGVLVNPDAEIDHNLFYVHYHVEAAGIVHLVIFNLSGAPIVLGVSPVRFTLFHP